MTHVMIRNLAIIIFIGSGLFLCTITDNTGNPATTGSNQTNVPEEGTVPAIFADPDSLYVLPGDTLAIRIKVMRDTNVLDSIPLSNALIIVNNNSQGWINSDSLYTNSDGRVTLLFSDTLLGDREILLKCFQVEKNVRFKVSETPDQVQKNIIALPELNSIKADGKSHTYINVKVINDNHNPLVGEAVQFITTAGVIAGEFPPPGFSGQSISNADGIAKAKLTSANINDTAYITVYLVSDRNLSDETQVSFQGVKINTYIDSTNLKIGSNTVLTAEVLNGADEPIANIPVFFKLGKGSNSNITITGSDSLTGFDGKANISLYGSSTGTDTVIIAAAGARSSTKINVTNLILKLDLDANVLQASSQLSTNLNVIFTNVNNQLLANKQMMVVRKYLDADDNPISDTLTGTTNSVGEVDFTIYALDYEADMKLEVIGFNSATDVASSEIMIQFIKTRTITIYALPALILANGTSKSKITVQVKNDLNNPIVGDKISFSSNAGIIPSSAVTNAEGKAIVELISDRRNTIATVRAYLSKDITQKDSIYVEFAGVEISATASPKSINSTGLDTSTITVKLIDASKNPITGEDINFYKQQALTTLIPVEQVTDNRGEARCKVVGTSTGVDTITIEAAGAKTQTVIYYSSNKLTIDTLPGSFATTIANGKDSTSLILTYKDGSGNVIPNAMIEVSVTLGNLGTVFAKKCTTNTAGQATIKMLNPEFANTATIAALAYIGSEITSCEFDLYFRADMIDYIRLNGSPEVISTNGDRATIIAVAYDSMDNRVKDAHISFNLIDGPGGGEYLKPPLAVTGVDGTAMIYLVSGSIPSQFHGVKVVAGDYTAIKSDTLYFTIAGPPHNITIRSNISELNKYNSTYGKHVAAIVTDVNGNPVADGTEVTFSLNIIGYKTYHLAATFEYYHYWSNGILYTGYHIDIDTVGSPILVFEDLNNNFILDDEKEDYNNDGMLNRGENVNGDRDENGDDLFQPGPGFHDINWNGRRDYKFNFNDWVSYVLDSSSTYPYLPAEPFRSEWVNDSTIRVTHFADYNGNNFWDQVEPLINSNMSDSAYENMPGYDPGLECFPDIDWNQNGVCDPATAVTIERTVQTVGGVADNEIIYGQSDALRINIRISAESKGLVAKTPEELILPILIDDLPYWQYKPSNRKNE